MGIFFVAVFSLLLVWLIANLISYAIDFGHWKFHKPQVNEYYVYLNYHYKHNMTNPFETYNDIEFVKINEIKDNWVAYTKYRRSLGEYDYRAIVDEYLPLKEFMQHYAVPCNNAKIKMNQILRKLYNDDLTRIHTE